MKILLAVLLGLVFVGMLKFTYETGKMHGAFEEFTRWALRHHDRSRGGEG